MASPSYDALVARDGLSASHQLLVDAVPRGARVLDVGCAGGYLALALREEREASVLGVEPDPAAVDAARRRGVEVIAGSVEDPTVLAAVRGEYDAVVCGDVLEHLVDPWTVLRGLGALLDREGCVVASLPNVGHLDTHLNLVFRRRWPYRQRGIHDETHLRFFALANVRDLFRQAGLEIVALRRHYRLIDRPHRVNRLAPLLALPGLRELFAYQYLVVARRSSDAA
jgi:methionine biosynthesis protein MetW